MNDLVVIKKTELAALVENAVRRVISTNQSTPKTKIKSGSIGISDVSDITGYTISTIYSKVHKRLIPFHKSPNGSKLIFFEDEIREWMNGNLSPTQSQRVEMKLQSFNEGRTKK